MSPCTQISVLHLCAWVGVHEWLEEGVYGGEGSLGRLVLSPAVQASFPHSTSLPKDIMPRLSGPTGKDIVAGSFEIFQGNVWENPVSTLLLGAITAVFFMALLNCWGEGSAGGHCVLGHRAGPPHHEDKSFPYLFSLPSSVLPVASAFLGAARTGAPKRKRSRGCSPAELCGLGLMPASSNFASLMPSTTGFTAAC